MLSMGVQNIWGDWMCQINGIWLLKSPLRWPGRRVLHVAVWRSLVQTCRKTSGSAPSNAGDPETHTLWSFTNLLWETLSFNRFIIELKRPCSIAMSTSRGYSFNHPKKNIKI